MIFGLHPLSQSNKAVATGWADRELQTLGNKQPCGYGVTGPHRLVRGEC